MSEGYVVRKIGKYGNALFLNLKDVIPYDWKGSVVIKIVELKENEIVLRIKKID